MLALSKEEPVESLCFLFETFCFPPGGEFTVSVDVSIESKKCEQKINLKNNFFPDLNELNNRILEKIANNSD